MQFGVNISEQPTASISSAKVEAAGDIPEVLNLQIRCYENITVR
jgi:hypothetical protein